MKWDLKSMDNALRHKNIVVSTIYDDDFFQRRRLVKINGRDYVFVWWSNVCYLLEDDMIIPFRRFEQSGTWPNQKKTNLQFYDGRGEVCCVIGIEDYPKEIS